jgi:hypothetical protein
LRRRVEECKYLPGDIKSTGALSLQNDKVVRKAELEKILCQLLGFLTPDTFQVIP